MDPLLHPPPSAREAEAVMLDRCAAAAQDGNLLARDQREANVFRLAAMVLQSRQAQAAQSLRKVSEHYFASHPDELLPAEQVLRRAWVHSLPRLRDMLTQRLLRA